MWMLHWLGCNLCLNNAVRLFDIHLWLFLAFCNLSLTFSWHSDSAISTPRPWLPICVCVFLVLIAAHPGICHISQAFLFTHLHFHCLHFLFSSVSKTTSFRRDAKSQPASLGSSVSEQTTLMSNSKFTHIMFRHIIPQRSRTESQLCFNAVTLSVHGIHECL